MVQLSTYNPLLSLARSEDIISSGIKFPVQMAKTQQDLENAGLKNLLADREMRLKERELNQKLQAQENLRNLMGGMQGMSLQQQAEAMIRSGNPDLISKGTSLFNAIKKSSPETIINVGGEDFLTSIGKEGGKRLLEDKAKAEEAILSLQSTVESKALLKEGMFTGTLAEQKVRVGKALQEAGINFFEDEVANTEAFVASRGREVGRLIQLFGAGTGLSDADREYAERAAAGKVILTEKSIRRILDINDRAARNVIKRYQTKASKIKNRYSGQGKELPFDIGLDFDLEQFDRGGVKQASDVNLNTEKVYSIDEFFGGE